MGDWSLPGGMQEIGETVFEAAAREVREETGVTISDIALIDVVDSITRDDDARVQFHYTLVDVVAKWRSGEPAASAQRDGPPGRCRQRGLRERPVDSPVQRVLQHRDHLLAGQLLHGHDARGS